MDDAAASIAVSGSLKQDSGVQGQGLTVRVNDNEDLVGNAMSNTRCAELASLAEQADIRCA